MPLKLISAQSKAAQLGAGGQSNLLTYPYIYYILLNTIKSESAKVRRKREQMPKYMHYDFFGQEWQGICASCRKELFAPTRADFIANRLYHTRNECGGGY